MLSERATEYIINFWDLLLHKQMSIHFWKIGLFQTGIELIYFSFLIFLFLLFYNSRPRQVLFISFTGFVVLFICHVLYYSVNIPINSPGTDDYMVFLNFLNHYSSTKNVEEIFSQFDDVREIFRRLISVILFHLHAFNFKTLILFANSCLMGIILLFYRTISLERKHKDFLFLILIILVFQFEYYDATLWASGGTTAICLVFFAFASFYFLSK